MKRLVFVFLALALMVAGCKKKSEPPPEGGGGGGPVVSPESTAVYFGVTPDSSFIYYDSTFSPSVGNIVDTVQTIYYSYIRSGSDLKIPHTDTFWISGNVYRDTLLVKAETLYENVVFTLDTTIKDTIRFRQLLGKKPLRINDSWIPIYPFTQALRDTVKRPFSATCTLVVKLDSLRFDSSFAKVIDTLTITVPAGSFSTFRIINNRYARLFYTVSTLPIGCLPISGDTNADLISYDTTYVKPYYGLVLYTGKDSTVFRIPMFGDRIDITKRFRTLTGKR